jgi:uncharacterized membrane protein
MLVPAGALFFDTSLAEIGVLGMILASKAMALNLLYNWLFDRVDARAGRISSERSHFGRILHALGFELTLMATSLPILMFWLNIGMFEALAADFVVITFVVAYTYVFTLIYDRTFPLRQAGPMQV